jgi:hypothetical protein
MIHSSNKRKRDVKSVVTAKMLAKLVYCIDTSKVTEDGTEDENNSKEEESDNDGNPSASKKIAIESMQIFVGKKEKAMPLEMESTNEDGDDNMEDREEGQKEGKEVGESDDEEKVESGMEEDQDKEEGKQESEEEEEMDDNLMWERGIQTRMLLLLTREEAQHQPVRLRDCYPEPQRQVSQKRLPQKPPE